MKNLLFTTSFLFVATLLSAQYKVTLSMSESTSGGCGQQTNCGGMTVCYDLYATPSKNGASVSSYDIWFVINGGSSAGVVYSSDGSCIITDNTDLPAENKTTFVRVGATDGNSANVLSGKTKLHNFCITYSSKNALKATTITAGGSFAGFNSNMSVIQNNLAVNAEIVPVTLKPTSSNTSCLQTLLSWLLGGLANTAMVENVNPSESNDEIALSSADSDMNVTSKVISDELQLFPNPVNDVLHVQRAASPLWLESTTFEIIATQGKLMSRGVMTNAQAGIDVSALPQGHYILRVIEGNSVSTRAFIKA